MLRLHFTLVLSWQLPFLSFCTVTFAPYQKSYPTKENRERIQLFFQTFHIGFLKRKPGMFTETHTLYHTVKRILSASSSNIFLR